MPGPAIRADYTPHGIVEERYHPCSIPGPKERRMIVYLPADYYSNDECYPVLYLLHGARGYETSWIRFGEVYHTADSLWERGMASKCIIVMPNVNQYNDEADYEGGRFKDAYESILEVDGTVEMSFMKDYVHYVDSVYRTVQDGEHRAVAGLSIGGWQSICFAANYPDEFRNVGAMSPYFWSIGRPGYERGRFYHGIRRKMGRQYRESPPDVFCLYVGKWDMMRPPTVHFKSFMRRHGYPYDYFVYPESHDWPQGWTQELKDFMQRIFK